MIRLPEAVICTYCCQLSAVRIDKIGPEMWAALRRPTKEALGRDRARVVHRQAADLVRSPGGLHGWQDDDPLVVPSGQFASTMPSPPGDTMLVE